MKTTGVRPDLLARSTCSDSCSVTLVGSAVVVFPGVSLPASHTPSSRNPRRDPLSYRGPATIRARRGTHPRPVPPTAEDGYPSHPPPAPAAPRKDLQRMT